MGDGVISPDPYRLSKINLSKILILKFHLENILIQFDLKFIILEYTVAAPVDFIWCFFKRKYIWFYFSYFSFQPYVGKTKVLLKSLFYTKFCVAFCSSKYIGILF